MTHAAVDIDARADLRAAIETRSVAFEALSKAQAAAKRAAELLAGAEHRLHQFSGLEREIENATAARIALWAAKGGEQPSLDPEPKFAEPLRERAEAQQHANVARSAAATLGAALDDAKQKFGSADAKVKAATDRPELQLGCEADVGEAYDAALLQQRLHVI
jgi:hypothetical protein